MNQPIEKDTLVIVAESAYKTGGGEISKEILSAISDNESLSYSELNMWFENIGKMGACEHFKNAGVALIADYNGAILLQINRARNAKIAAYNPVNRLKKGLNPGLSGALVGGYWNDTERPQSQSPLQPY